MHLWKELLCKAYVEAQKSPDPSTKTGALVVWRKDDVHHIWGRGCNRFLDGVEVTQERLTAPLKYMCIAHAECIAIFDALKSLKTPLSAMTMVAPWAACSNCGKTIIMSGIKTLVRHKQAHLQSAGNLKWKEEIEVADIMMREAGIKIIEYDGAVGAPPSLASGQYWNP